MSQFLPAKFVPSYVLKRYHNFLLVYDLQRNYVMIIANNLAGSIVYHVSQITALFYNEWLEISMYAKRTAAYP